jgi:raffinose/stachyose/melibiose transport system substrate-binding protein
VNLDFLFKSNPSKEKPMLRKLLALTVLLSLLLSACAAPAMPAAPAAEMTEAAPAEAAPDGEVTELVMGSWRVDDVAAMEKILAAFTASHPDITVKFDPTNPPDYNATLRTQLEAGTGPDLMYLRSYSIPRQLFADGFVESLVDMKDELVADYGEASLVPWSTLEGEPIGVPMIAVSHGIYYNKDMFKEMGLEVPTTWEGLLETAQKIQDAGKIPFANASKDTWTIAEIVFMNLAPTFIGGLGGRLAYLNGERCFNDENAVAAFQAVADIAPFFPPDQSGLGYYDSQALFATGEAAMFLGGSWDIPLFEKDAAAIDWGVFPVPAPEGGDRFVTFHLDAGMGINAASTKKDAAKVFLEWLNGPEFAKLLADELPGFFPIHLQAPELANAHAAEFLAMNAGAAGTDVRWPWDGLLDGDPSGYQLMTDLPVAVVNGTMTPQEAADALQEGMATWFAPAQTCAQ